MRNGLAVQTIHVIDYSAHRWLRFSEQRKHGQANMTDMAQNVRFSVSAVDFQCAWVLEAIFQGILGEKQMPHGIVIW